MALSSEHLVTFAAGASYGMTTVIVGQPLDTIKTRMQGLPEASRSSGFQVAKDLYFRQGLRGLYRGGLPLFVGGSFMRSAQFGVSSACKSWLEKKLGPTQHRFMGVFDYQVVLAGMAGGLGRGLVETPTDFFKTRRQVEAGWTLRHVLDGTAVTMGRNTGLFCAFVVYLDISKLLAHEGKIPSLLLTPDGTSLSPFAKGAICANLAWLTIWPLDVLKTQRQSGNFENNSTLQLLEQNIKGGKLFRGILPGLIRSTIANGSSMVVYEHVHSNLTNHFQLQRTDMT